MKKHYMKKYFQAIQEYERDNDSFGVLCKFISVKSSDLIKLYCTGKIHLPSFSLLKRLHDEFSEITEQDKQLELLFLNSIKCSKLFYSEMITAIEKANRGKKNFENIFTQKLQPLGQQLVSLLINIKRRVRRVRFKNQSPAKARTIIFLQNILSYVKPVSNQIRNKLHQAKLIRLRYNKLTKFLYYIVLTIIILSFGTIDYSFIDVPVFKNILMVVMLCLPIVVLTIFVYPKSSFGHIDINGKNVVSYQYQVFFNNLSNKKMYNIFTLQYADDARQSNDMDIDSTKCKNS